MGVSGAFSEVNKWGYPDEASTFQRMKFQTNFLKISLTSHQSISLHGWTPQVLERMECERYHHQDLGNQVN